MYEALKKNNVSAANQLKDSAVVRFHNPNGTGLKILFLGNSITLHGPKEEIGWAGEWGMAASTRERDYVHLLMATFSQKDTDTAYCTCQVANWERDYKNGPDHYAVFADARAFGADIIIARFVENCPSAAFDRDTFKTAYEGLIDYVNRTGKAKVIYTSSFWRHPGDGIIEQIAAEHNSPFVSLGDLGQRNDMMAIGKFWHSGVAVHPGDLGMEQIANRIWNAINL